MKSKIASATEKKTLNLNGKNQSLWLVKVPTFVAEKWSQHKSDDLLGSLSISTVLVGPNSQPIKKININLNSDGSDEPEEFTLEELSSNDHQLLAFKLNENSESFSLQGQISKNLV